MMLQRDYYNFQFPEETSTTDILKYGSKEVFIWLDNNITHWRVIYQYNGSKFKFKTKEDLLLFTLRWL